MREYTRQMVYSFKVKIALKKFVFSINFNYVKNSLSKISCFDYLRLQIIYC